MNSSVSSRNVWSEGNRTTEHKEIIPTRHLRSNQLSIQQNMATTTLHLTNHKVKDRDWNTSETPKDAKSNALLSIVNLPLPPRPSAIIPNPPQKGTVINFDLDDTETVNQQDLEK